MRKTPSLRHPYREIGTGIRPYALWLAEQNGTYTWKTPIQKDIEEAIAASLTWKQFLRVLEKQGYTFRFDRKYPTLILPGTGRTVRFKTGKTTPLKPSKPHPVSQASSPGWETNTSGQPLPYSS